MKPVIQLRLARSAELFALGKLPIPQLDLGAGIVVGVTLKLHTQLGKNGARSTTHRLQSVGEQTGRSRRT